MQEPLIFFPVAPEEFYKSLKGLIEEVIDERSGKALQKMPEELAEKTLLVPKEVCQVLRISRPTLYLLIKEGKLKGFRIQSRRFFARTDVEKIMRKQYS